MNILGSSFEPVMNALQKRLEGIANVRPFDGSMPLSAQLTDIDVMILGAQRVTPRELAAAPRLKLIHQHGRGVDGVDLSAAVAAGVAVANVPGANSVGVAEHTLALMLYLAKGFHQVPDAIDACRLGFPAGIELAGKTLGIIGLGASGTELAKRAIALGMRVMAIRRDPLQGSATPVHFLGGPKDLMHVLANADFVALLSTMSANTSGMIGREQLQAMKRSAYLVNTARAGLVDREALRWALDERVIAGAGFDVFWSEPVDRSDPMLSMPGFVLTPHVAGFSDCAIDHVTGVMAENIIRMKNGTPLINVVA